MNSSFESSVGVWPVRTRGLACGSSALIARSYPASRKCSNKKLTTIWASSDPPIAVRKLTCRSVGWGGDPPTLNAPTRQASQSVEQKYTIAAQRQLAVKTRRDPRTLIKCRVNDLVLGKN